MKDNKYILCCGLAFLLSLANVSVAADFWTNTSADIYNNNVGNVGVNDTTPTYKLDVGGDMGIQDDLFLTNWDVDQDGEMNWYGDVHVFHPTGTGVLRHQTQLTNTRTGFTVLPTRGTAITGETDRCEFRIYRTTDTTTNYSVLRATTFENGYRVIDETAGTATAKPLRWTVTKTGTGAEELEAIKVDVDGKVHIGYDRNQPRDTTTNLQLGLMILMQSEPTVSGTIWDSDHLRLTSKLKTGGVVSSSDWRLSVDATSHVIDSDWQIISGKDGANFATRLKVSDDGDVTVVGGDLICDTSGEGVLLESSTKSWLITVNTSGVLVTTQQ